MIWNLLMADKSSAFFFILRGARRIFIRPEWKRTQPGFPTQCNQIADCDKNFTLIYQPVDLCGLSATWLADFNAINFNSFDWFFLIFEKFKTKFSKLMIYCWNVKQNEPHQMIYAVPVIGGRTSEAESIYRIIPVSLCFFPLKITKIFLKSSPKKKLMKETEKIEKKNGRWWRHVTRPTAKRLVSTCWSYFFVELHPNIYINDYGFCGVSHSVWPSSSEMNHLNKFSSKKKKFVAH